MRAAVRDEIERLEREVRFGHGCAVDG